ncbi:GEVED domain-containing protein [Epilithonimonas mollis]|uniref:Por secretion system C-terminal sorting domain-containing protein n=1 Tax=Epilithonimonas mollis TaxID=216903 RepID=A0A1M6SB31_9FLAO|nr:GEVED domain-containing protein [Epilithonimonas mollis]SHK41964.1 Por secretion system C-terminal sorting domain-containing protein [Epilithonimonas mollis]
MKNYLFFRQKFEGFFVLTTFLFSFFILIGFQGLAQVTLPHLDAVNYTAGQSLQTQTNWTVLNTGDDILITSGNLSYSGLAASSGNKFAFDGAGIDAAKLFTQQTSGTVYYSFLLNVSNLGSLNTSGSYFTGLNEGTGTSFGATVWTRKNGTGYDIGLNPRTTAANTVWTFAQTVANTLLVVVSYQLVSGSGNDVVKLWVNPAPGSVEPVATLSATNTGTDLANLNRIFVRQDAANTTPFIEMDEMRIGTSWASVTPAATVCSSPSNQASAFSSSAIAQTSATVEWERGNGTGGVLVLARAGGAVNADPVNGTGYTPDSAFGSGTQIGTGNYVVYDGTGTSVNVSALAAGTVYHFAVYEYNAVDNCYNLSKLTGHLATVSPPVLSASGTLNEISLDGATIALTLTNDSFADTVLSNSNFILNNQPAGVSIQPVAYNSPTSATITLAYDNTDFDTDVANFSITLNGSELTSASSLTSNNLTITAVAETFSVGNTLPFGNVCSGSSKELSFTITGTNLKPGTIILSAVPGYSYSETSGGTSITSFSQSGGNLSKVIYVTLSPVAANQVYNGNIAVSGAGAVAVNKTVSGNSTVTASFVHTNTANSIGTGGANFRANNTIYGTCPNTSSNGFVYSLASGNATPTIANGGTDVSVVLNTSNTTFAQSVSGLAEGTTYAYQAYLFDGITYTYGGVQTFTTTISAPANVTNAKACLTDEGGTISWTAPSVLPTGYMVFAVPAATYGTGSPTTSNGDYAVANSDFSLAQAYGSLGKLLYKGSSTSVNITGLAENTVYSFRVISYREGGSIRSFSNGTTSGSLAENYLAQDDVKTFAGAPFNNQVTLNWTYNQAVSCFDEVMIVANQGAVSFTPAGDGSGYTANSVYSGGNQVVYKGTATSRAITGLTNGLEYCFKIWVRKGTVWSDGTGVCVTPDISYCSSSGASNNSGILKVEFNTINQTSTSTAGYTNNTAISTSVVLGNSYNLNVMVDTNGNYTSYVKAWIDWNKNGTFETSEAYELGTVTNSTSGTPSSAPYTIMVPNNATIGNVRMRIAANTDNTINNYSTPCQAFTYGEVEDYTIMVTQAANAEINIKGNNINIPNNFDEPYGLNNTLFASTNLGSDSGEKEFVIENLGLSDLILNGTPIVKIEGLHLSDFIVTQQAVSPVVNGVVSSFKIKFHPTLSGLREANVSIASNDSDENPYVFKIQGTGTCTPPSITTFPLSGPADTKVTFFSSVNDLTGASVSYNGVSLSFDLISSGKIETHIPAGAGDANFVITLANGCTFTQAFDVIDNLLTDCESSGSASSGSPASDLIIYEIYDESGGSGGIVTLYNRTASTVNLNAYSIQRAGDYGGTYTTYANLSGTIASGAVAVIGVSSSLCGYAPTGNGSFGSTGFNANDGFRLMKGSAIVDDVHAPNTVGYYIRRKNDFLSPRTVFDTNEWTSQILSTGQCLSSSEVAQQPVVKNPPVVTLQPSYFPNCDTDGAVLNITASEGFAGGNGLTYQWYVLGSSGTWSAVTDNSIYSGATSQTLTISDITGLNNYQYYCQARENAATCFTATKAVSVKEATSTWADNAWSNGTPVLSSRVVISGSYNTQVNGALDVCELTVSPSGTILVKPNNPVKVKKKIKNQNPAANSFVVESDANVIQTDDVINEGSIKVQRQVSNMNNVSGHIDYVYWSSPVSGQPIKGTNGFSPDTPANGYLQYNESNDKFTVTADATFQTGKGYAIRAENVLPDGYSKIYGFTGIPNNGNLQYLSLQKSAGTDKGYNLVGNPYPSNISFDLLYSLNSSKIYNTAWFWTNIDYTSTQMGAGYTGNNYAVYNGSGGVPPMYDWADYDPENPSGITPNGTVKVGQAFIVKAKAAGALDFNNGIRTADNGTFYQKGAVKDRFWLTMRSPKNMINTILIGYISGATNDYETDFDGELFVVGSDSFYSVLGAKRLAIQGKTPDFTAEDIVPLGNVFAENGTYTIGLQTPEGIFEGSQNIYLRDKMLNKYINLNMEKSYTFTAVKGTDISRFEIVYKDGTVLGSGAHVNSDFQIYKDGHHQVIKSSEKLGKVDVFDASGKLIKSLFVKGTELRLNTIGLTNGIYILKAENSGDAKMKKFIK